MSCHVHWMTSLIKVRSKSHLKKMTRPGLLIRSSQKFEFATFFMFWRVRNPFLTSLSCHVTSNPGQLPVQEVLENVLKFFHYLCFRGQGIHCGEISKLYSFIHLFISILKLPPHRHITINHISDLVNDEKHCL